MAKYTTINNIQGVDEALLAIAKAEVTLENFEAHRQAKMEEMRKETAQEEKRLAELVQKLTEQITEFAEKKKTEIFVDKKSVELPNGKIGYRLSAKLEYTEDEKKTIAACKKLGLTHCINVKESADKNAIKKLDEKQMKKVGAEIVIEENLYINPIARSNKELLGA